MRRGTGQFDGAGATEELFLSGPSPRSRRSCIKKPHRKSSSKPPLRHAEVLALVTCLHCRSCLIITKSKGMTVLGVGASQVAGLLGEGPHPAGGRAGMMGRETTEGRGRIRGQRGMGEHRIQSLLTASGANPDAMPSKELPIAMRQPTTLVAKPTAEDCSPNISQPAFMHYRYRKSLPR